MAKMCMAMKSPTPLLMSGRVTNATVLPGWRGGEGLCRVAVADPVEVAREGVAVVGDAGVVVATDNAV
jgi:hypothetical protein